MSVPSTEAFSDAAVYYRPAARQLVIDSGTVETSDRGSPNPQPKERWLPGGHGMSDPEAGGRRQAITTFSKRSRRRLRRWLHAIPRDADCLFVTLTYHETDPSPATAKEHLDKFCKRLERAYPACSVVWKMEPQERGTVHFHLLVYGVQYIPALQLSEAWHECTNEDSKAHRKAGVDIERGVHNEDGKLQAYFAKYMGKEVSEKQAGMWENPGRWWGIRFRDNLPLGSWEPAIWLTEAEAQAMIYALLDEWGVELPEYTSIPSLTVNCKGDPADAIAQLP